MTRAHHGPEAASRDGNNFDAIRLSAALAVLISHAFTLTGIGADEPIRRLSGDQTTLGRMAVAVFFVVSGWLITQSYVRSGSPIAFLRARALRILPALCAALVILAFLVGPLLSTVPAREYFADRATWRFVLVNASLLRFTDGLPGVFEDLPFERSLVGSLWTLHYEAICYAAVLLLGLASLLTRAVSLAAFAVCLTLFGLGLGGDGPELGAYFAAGSALYLWRAPMLGWLAATGAGACALALPCGGWWLASTVGGSYAVVYVATARDLRLPSPARWGDLSYGTYIFAFPVQQAATLALGAAATWYWNVLASLPVTLGLAFVSWHLIEKPALSLKADRRIPALNQQRRRHA